MTLVVLVVVNVRAFAPARVSDPEAGVKEVTVPALPVTLPVIVELKVLVPVNVCPASVLAIVALALGKVKVLAVEAGPDTVK